MLTCFAAASEADARPIWALQASAYPDWLKGQPAHVQAWLEGMAFDAKPAQMTPLPGADGAPIGALCMLSEPIQFWDVATVRTRLRAGDWRFDATTSKLSPAQAALAWALASYRFDRYRQRNDEGPRLAIADDDAARRVQVIAEAVYLARDLINTPAADLGPAELADAARGVAERFGAELEIVVAADRLREGFPALHAVGQGSPRAPRVIDLRWGDEQAPKLTLVGKGVCFDTGGLDLKSASNMQLMKKDMGGGAVTLGLAQAVMALDLPVRLRLLIGAVENSVSGASFRPGDVLQTRKGLTVEIGNTDAEGRLVLADLLAEADTDKPDLMIDCATLTGAARVALGPDLPALFTPDDQLAEDLVAAGRSAAEPLWRLPLHQPYHELIESPIADLNNAGSSGLAGAVTAALFLQDFVTETRAWAHLDIYGWNPTDRPGRPKGGEATALRALLAAIEQRFTG